MIWKDGPVAGYCVGTEELCRGQRVDSGLFSFGRRWAFSRQTTVAARVNPGIEVSDVLFRPSCVRITDHVSRETPVAFGRTIDSEGAERRRSA